MKRVEIVDDNKSLVVLHNSTVITTGVTDVIKRLQAAIQAADLHDPLDHITCVRVPATLDTYDIEFVAQTGQWATRYTFDNVNSLLVTAQLGGWRLEAIETLQVIRGILSELHLEHGLLSVDYQVSASPSAIHDTFTEAIDTLLPLHAPEIRSGWTEVFDNTPTGADAFVIAASGAVRPGSTLLPSVGQAYTVQPNPSSADQTVEAIISVIDTSNNTRPVGLFVRRVDNNNYYALRVWGNGVPSPSMALLKVLGGSVTTLATVDETIAAGDKFKLEVVGTTIKGYRNDVEVLSSTDGALTNPGTWGLFFGSFGAFTGNLFAWNITEFWAS